jgi:hypothetical protein
MTIDKLRQDLQRLGSRVGAQALTFAAMAASTVVGYKLHEVMEQTRFDRVVADGLSATASVVSAFFRMDSTIAMLLVPALIVGGLALGGMYVWGRQNG